MTPTYDVYAWAPECRLLGRDLSRAAAVSLLAATPDVPRVMLLAGSPPPVGLWLPEAWVGVRPTTFGGGLRWALGRMRYALRLSPAAFAGVWLVWVASWIASSVAATVVRWVLR